MKFVTDNQYAERLCFVGAGDFGRKIGENLYRVFQRENSTCMQASNKSPRLNIVLDPNKINFDSYPDKEHLIFLADSPLDNHFWKARDFILSKHPKYLISICPPEIGFKVKGSLIFKNEILIIAHDKPIHTAVNIINDVYSSLSSPGPINLDLEDISDALSNGIGFGITMESTKDNSIRELKHFANRHLNTIKKHENLILFFSVDNAVDPDMDYQTDLSETVYRAVGDEMSILWCSMNHRKLDPNFRATIIGS